MTVEQLEYLKKLKDDIEYLSEKIDRLEKAKSQGSRIQITCTTQPNVLDNDSDARHLYINDLLTELKKSRDILQSEFDAA